MVFGLTAETMRFARISSPPASVDAGGAILLDDDAFDAGTGARLDAERLGSLRHGIGDRTHAAARQCQARLHAIRRTGEAVVEKQERIRRARPQMRAERRVEGDDALQPLVRQFVVEHVGDIDEDQAQELAHVVAAEAS